MGSYIIRQLPVVTGTAGANLTEGTAVVMSSTGILSAITNTGTDAVLGVVADFENAVDGVANISASINVITKSPVFKIRCNGAVTKGAGLIATGSNGQFKAAGQVYTVSGSSGAVTVDGSYTKYHAIALSAGADNDIIPAVAPWF